VEINEDELMERVDGVLLQFRRKKEEYAKLENVKTRK
jgi:hypothetical protein